MAQTHDPLAAYRKSPPAPVTGAKATSETEEYVAFGTRNDAYCLEIRSAEDSADSPGYNILLTINHDRKMGTHFTLIFSIMAVHVRGKNLRPVVFALQNHKAEYIEAFDPRRFEKPKDANAPIIDSIEICLIENGSQTGGTQH